MIIENSIPGDEALNSFNKKHYGGPCPPPGAMHHYFFDLYALDTKLILNEEDSSKNLLGKIQGHIINKTQLVGLYKK